MRTGREASAFRSTVSKQHDVSDDGKALTPTLPAACTSACTSEAENANAGTLDASSPAALPQTAAALNEHQGYKGDGAAAIEQGDVLAKLTAAL